MAGNDATEVNPAIGVGISLNDHGSDWLWTAFSIFGLTALVHAGYTLYHFRKDNNKFKAYVHVGPLFASMMLAYTYFTLASNLGWTAVDVEFHNYEGSQDVRQVFYARYIGWFLAFPALLYTFELNAQAQNVVCSTDLFHIFHHLILQIGSTEIFVLGLLIGALIPSSYKWGYWTFAVTAQIFALTLLLLRQLAGDRKASSKMNWLVMTFFSICFMLYPVSWGLSEGGNVISVVGESAFYGVLDVVNFCIIPFVVYFDSVKNGTFVEGTPAANADVEKAIHEAPEMRDSHETEVHEA